MPKIIEARPAEFPVSDRDRPRRLHQRGRCDQAGVYEILDAAMIYHITFGGPSARMAPLRIKVARFK